MTSFTIIDADGASEVDARTEGGDLRITAQALSEALGWELKPQGLCRGDVCIPVAARPGLVAAGTVDLAGFADLVDRPLVIDMDEAVAYVGGSATTQQLAGSPEAPDFSLPDLEGHHHALSDYRGSKVLLVAWASW